ncbi:MAG: threonine--tRNA ligase [Nitrospirae bacterium CG_4_10_14_0_8_um_filter_41_23]|nr:threonine--tRNA ligase [Nitrospirota bacterium]PIQ94509.1 MAG: threonine--tRNA ligase [Nitrospirae bacterium CG11_big_fil_rev_8_21_14_0_20_41_14]PIV42900.1 MAG: threonine--tRNA ligase [Nitrospirae bacterium CG02_land_8_20_14_3_00_41_53]PIW87781.1 MAG: threonine--tRNA ligase [Nitrospirae bacterium CG_4_8_14_3_um_filter_41_47]PIY86892.1 MAG: threonine--tRNA ligase [Nitrospirae bacterium CG_4_10_14_0_8_um_filter_41_23]PJA79607.1 MAG: threonine--tRNA ligase [Nitrospirae bacterium CG_4_9_14_3_um
MKNINFDSKEDREIYRHSTSHIMAHAVKELFPDAKLAIGPAIDEGFYYDFDIDRAFTPEDLSSIEKKMSEVIKQDNPFVRKIVSKENAIELFKKKGEDYKVELLEEITDEEVSLYEEGGFVDLCRGPHIGSTGQVSAFKLLSIAGAYWRGNEKNKMLQRIYGTAFTEEKDLKKYLDYLEEVKKRDHRRLGKELDLFSIGEEIGAGLIIWHPNGALIRRVIEDFWLNEHYKAGYKILYTPHIAKLNLWQKSGHLDFYRENMYSPMEIEGIDYELRPMNCPFHIHVYKTSLRSYKNLPIRYAELGTVYRYERSGVLHGLLRVRGFTQDDAHIFCREDQIEDEILRVLDFTLFILRIFGFEHYDVYLSTRPEKYVGSLENWERSTNALKRALELKGLSYEIDIGEGVFYGPKIDIKVKDSLNRPWQCSTIQVDFNNPERFDMTYKGSDGKEHRPIMIHRALMGSLERFFGILIEHYAGAFPLWLAPVQVEVLTIAERHADYAIALSEKLRSEGIRTELNIDNEKIGYKIRSATVRKVPFLIITGDKEVSEKKVTVRKRSGENIGPFTIDEFIETIKNKISNKSLKI